MKNIILLFVTGCMFLSQFTLDAKSKCDDDLKRDVKALSKRLDGFEELHKREISKLKQELDNNKKEFALIKKALEDLKGFDYGSLKDVITKLEQQQRDQASSRELEQILVKYGNNPDGMLALHYAIKQGDSDAVVILLENGANPNAVDQKETTLTRVALNDQFEIAQILFSYGADINFTPEMNGGGTYTLHYAAQFSSSNLINLFIDHGAVLDYMSPDKKKLSQSPLHIAASVGNYEAVVTLVNRGAKVNGVRYEAGRGANSWSEGTPLDWAAHKLKYSDNPDNLELVKFLVENGARRQYHQSHPLPCPVIDGYLKSKGV